MPRDGRNPNKAEEAPAHFPDVITAVITHLPNQEGYHAQRLEIVQECLTTMRVPYVPMLVWDNGSCKTLTDWLTHEYKPEWLMLSGNVGKQAAWAAICRMLPPDTLVSLSDDDMQYKPGWLKASIDLFKHFPNVGVVSVWAVRGSFAWGNQKTIEWARQNATVEEGTFIPIDEVRDFWKSVGGAWELPQKQLEQRKDIRITYKGVQAYCEAQHCQFLGRAGTLAPFTQYYPGAMGREKDFDDAVDAAGLLRLTTTKQYARHLGNTK